MNKPTAFKKLTVAAMLLLIGCLLFAACTNSKTADNKKGGKAAKDELVLAIGSEPEAGFDPTTGWGRYGSPLFQSTLFKRDNELNVINDLAEGYTVSGDGLVWTVTLRGDVRFSDGEALTSADVKFTFGKAASSGSAIDLTNLSAIDTDGERTVRFTLLKPDSTFLYTLVSLGIVPEHAYGDNYANEPIGSGPFKLVQWDKGQQLIVEANESYYGAKPAFRKLTFLFLAEDAAFAAAQAGQADVVSVPSAFAKRAVSGMKLIDLQTVDNRGILFPYVPSGGTTDDGHPVGNDVTADIAIRKAVNAAVNRQALVEGVLEGFGTPAYSVADGLPWWNPETVVPDGEIEAAQKILSAGGWTDADGDGVAEKGALKAEFSLLYPAGDVTRQSLALAAADQVKAAGIRIVAEGKSWEEIDKLMHSNAILFGWGSHDPLEMYNLYSTAYRGVDYYNTGYYSNPKVDAWMEQALRATDEQTAIDNWRKAQWDGTTGFSALGDAPWAWLVNLDHLYLVNGKLDIGKPKIQPHGHGWPMTDNIAEWKWVE